MKTTEFFERKIKATATDAAQLHIKGKMLERVIEDNFNEIPLWTRNKHIYSEYDVEYTFEEYKEKFMAAYNAAK